MSFSIPLLTLLALTSTGQVPIPGAGKAATIAPFVGEETSAVGHLDLGMWTAPNTSREILGNLADDPEIVSIVRRFDHWVNALRKAGATELFLLIEQPDPTEYPVLVVPLSGSANPRAIADLLTGTGPDSLTRWPAVEVLQSAVVAGPRAALTRLRGKPALFAPGLNLALATGRAAPFHLAITPTPTQRRVIEETMPTLPRPLGADPITAISRGMSWASISLATRPRPSVQVVIQGRDTTSAGVLRKVAEDALKLLAEISRTNPTLAELVGPIAAIKPEAIGDRVTLDAELGTAAALVAIPVRRAREATRRTLCTNNLKQIGLAMHNYHDTHKSFPPAYLAAKDGRPLLSWRVLILPFLDQQKELYDQFHLDEAWDSPHNRALVARMPRVFACPDEAESVIAQGKTTYLAPRGPATILRNGEGIKIQEVTDGTSNTLFAVDAGDDLAVEWTRPADWETVPSVDPRRLLGHHPGGTLASLADGSVRFVRESVSPRTWRALTTSNGGERIDDNDY